MNQCQITIINNNIGYSIYRLKSSMCGGKKVYKMYSDLNISINQCLQEKHRNNALSRSTHNSSLYYSYNKYSTSYVIKGENLSCKIQGNQICKDTELLQKSFSCRSLLFLWCWLMSRSWTESVPVPKNLVSKWQKYEKQEQCQWHKHSRCGKGHQGCVSCCSEDSECQGRISVTFWRS